MFYASRPVVYSEPAFRRMQISEPGWAALNFKLTLLTFLSCTFLSNRAVYILLEVIFFFFKKGNVFKSRLLCFQDFSQIQAERSSATHSLKRELTVCARSFHKVVHYWRNYPGALPSTLAFLQKKKKLTRLPCAITAFIQYTCEPLCDEVTHISWFIDVTPMSWCSLSLVFSPYIEHCHAGSAFVICTMLISSSTVVLQHSDIGWWWHRDKWHVVSGAESTSLDLPRER